MQNRQDLYDLLGYVPECHGPFPDQPTLTEWKQAWATGMSSIDYNHGSSPLRDVFAPRPYL